MSGSIIDGAAEDKSEIGYLGSDDSFGKIQIVKREHFTSAIPIISHCGDWCVYDKSRFCQESRCCDCAVNQEDE